MSGTFQKIIIVGHLGADPEIKEGATSGELYGTLRVATSKKWKGADGQLKEKTEWHRVRVFKKHAEVAQKYLTKGQMVLIEGENETRKYEKDGVTHYTTEVITRAMQMLGSRSSERQTAKEKPAKPDIDDSEEFEDDLPF